MIDAYVPSDNEPVSVVQPNRRTLYVWLLAGLCLFLALAIFGYLAQNMPQINQAHDNRIEGYRQRFKCNSGEVLVVEEFASGLYKADCMARG